MPKIKEQFLRYEFKYIVNDTVKNLIESELVEFMYLDPFVEQFTNKQYFVRSLYFDDPYYSFYYEKTDGLMHRQKLRIRTYGKSYNITLPVILELKGRYNNYVYKNRVEIKHSTTSISDITNLLDQNKLYDNPVYEQYMYDKYAKFIQPVMLIDYNRRAYQSNLDYEFRVTFDGDIYGTQTDELFPSNDYNKRKLIDGYTIMEVKFRKHMPPWFHRIILNHQMNRISISKYCTGMETTNLIQNLDN
jgi:SPX domain protein involved in polyphosphate accumulation